MDSTPKRKLINRIRQRKKRERERIKAEKGEDASSSDSDEPVNTSSQFPERNFLMPFDSNGSPKTPLRCISSCGINSSPGGNDDSQCYSPPTPSFQESEKLMKIFRREQKRHRRLAKKNKPMPGLLNNSKFLLSLEAEEPELLDQSTSFLEIYNQRLNSIINNESTNKDERDNRQNVTNVESGGTVLEQQGESLALSCNDPSSSSTQSTNEQLNTDSNLLNDSADNEVLLACLLQAESRITPLVCSSKDQGKKELELLDEDEDYFLAVNIP